MKRVVLFCSLCAGVLSSSAFEAVWCAWDNAGDAAVRSFAATRPVFAHELLGEVNATAKDVGEGFLSYDLEALAADPSVTNRPGFFINLRPRTFYNAREFYFGKFRHDGESYRLWRERHPTFRGFLTLEWVNDSLAPLDRPKGLMKSKRRNSLTEEELKIVQTRICEPTPRADFVNRHLKDHFDRIVQYSFDDPKSVLIGDGATCASHLAAKWGAGALAFESTRDHLFYQIQMMFCRGAARQFRLPWMWYVASYIDGSRDGKYVSNCRVAEELPTWKDAGPNFGISLSALKRTTYLSYLAGADYYEREAMPSAHFLRGTPPVRLSDEGRMFEAFMDFTKRTDRGEPYQPFALLVPGDRGYTRFGGKAFRRFEYTHADHMLDAVMATILENWRNNDPADLAAHQERVMANSRFGDLFDAITPDFENDPTLARTLPRYRAAFLFGETEGKADMVKTLLDWVQAGGTLVLSSAQLSGALSEAAAGAVVLRADAEGRPLFLSKSCGAGRLIIGTKPYLTDWASDAAGREKCLKSVGYHGMARFPDLEWLVAYLEKAFVPVRVSGDVVQYGLNRTKDGWLVYLVNNAGVTKVWDKTPVFDPKPATVEVTFGTERRTVEVPSGEIVTVSLPVENRTETPPADFEILSYNIRHGEGTDHVVDLARAASVIAARRPRFAAVQEVDVGRERSFGQDQAEELGRMTGLVATFARGFYPKDGTDGEYGVTLLSQATPLSVRRIPLPGREPRVLLLCEFADCFVGTTHLDVRDAACREASVQVIREAIADLPKPVFLSGDWNAHPDSEVLAGISRFMQVVSVTNAVGGTFHGFPERKSRDRGKCLDYIAVDRRHADGCTVREACVLPERTVSDHAPISVRVSLTER